MERQQLINSLLPAIIRYDGVSRETADRIIGMKTTSELGILYAKFVRDGRITPPAPVVTEQDVEAERQRGQREIDELRERYQDKTSEVLANREADRLEFRRQQDEAAIPERREAILKARQRITDAQSVLRSFTLNEAVFTHIIRELGVDVDTWSIQQALDSNAISLPAPSESERQAWAEQDVIKHNRRLLDMRPDQLKEEIKREAAQRRQQVEQAEAERVQKLQEQTDSYLNYPPLPEFNEKGEKFDSGFFRRATAEQIRRYAKRYGIANLNKRIMGR